MSKPSGLERQPRSVRAPSLLAKGSKGLALLNALAQSNAYEVIQQRENR
ncbi:hypothetical protein GGD83_004761 [Rhodoblastus sphagnicola]|nr:hypothetical protein [Rhodoblastus sphagnicola]